MSEDSPQELQRFLVHAATILVIVPALVILNGIYRDLKEVSRRVRGLF